ncbi:MAG TPA: type II toxin-antitoxin system PemK/MazF family toxin [Verrucomicrobiae bacterium]|jgi:mRNA-degrading endonuclease toxin of MazEF toxin-antitoxin module
MPAARRGEIWLVDLGMVQKTRPVVILSIAFLDHERAVVTYVPRTTLVRGTRFEVSHEARGFETGVFDAQGLGGVPIVKLVRNMGITDLATLERVEIAVKKWLGLI